jgi:hypothetical protein
VKVHCDEGVATHVAPDLCAGVREDVGEASVGERIGQPLSREIVSNPGADVVHLTEGKIGRRATASACRTRRGLRAPLPAIVQSPRTKMTRRRTARAQGRRFGPSARTAQRRRCPGKECLPPRSHHVHECASIHWIPWLKIVLAIRGSYPLRKVGVGYWEHFSSSVAARIAGKKKLKRAPPRADLSSASMRPS